MARSSGGIDVTVLVRGKRFAELCEEGIVIELEELVDQADNPAPAIRKILG